MASESCTGTNFVFGGNHPDHDEYFACYDIMSGGWGGRFGHDGNDCVIAINGNCRFNPTEVFETRFPLRVEDCELVQDSGGPAGIAAGSAIGGPCSPTRSRSPAASAATGTWSSPGRCSAASPAATGDRDPEGRQRRWLTVKELYDKVSSSKYANIKLQPGRPHPADDAGRRRLRRPARARRLADRGGPARRLRLGRERRSRLRPSQPDRRAAPTRAGRCPARPRDQRSGYLGCQSRSRYSFS